MKEIIWVILGGGLGSLCRQGFTLIPGWQKLSFPLATLVANMVAAFLLGIFYQWTTSHPEKTIIRYFLMAGFCGGLSTFSTFSMENLQFLHQGDWPKLILYCAASIMLCLSCCAAGMAFQGIVK